MATEGNRLPLHAFSHNQLAMFSNNFANENIIGQGGSATVYRGRMPEWSQILGLPIAIKHIRPYRARQNDTATKIARGNEITRQLYQAEIDSLSLPQLQSPHILRLLGHGVSENTTEGHYLVYEMLDGQTLNQKLENDVDTMTWENVLTIIKGVAKGISVIHRSNFIHGDLKPHNIIVREDCHPVIIDFGSITVQGTKRQYGWTGGYVPLEAHNMMYEPVPSSKVYDIYSFGLVMMHAIMLSRSLSISDGHGSLLHIKEIARQRAHTGNIVDIKLMERGCTLREATKITKLALKCTEDDEEERPTIAKIISKLDGLNLTKAEKWKKRGKRILHL
ncbi:G-type lectin S-receptor-like serine/threonine-protein kinase B120 [Tripterygium wilfordii]|uniref:G-type lectin S-receptor-like serine/threonine-protein kinase B120 n=1 Tax=Tripterygium wilfordii TaxID=458696 RepID=UPI0018F84334|nr:G-type lectin S-receptor-like serine/threonine-protein kinase B120 [Tripterygium wilfordii]